jgi:DnaJ-class molecular chaperone
MTEPTSPEPGLRPGDEGQPQSQAAGENLCPDCDGAGRDADGESCQTCSGTGRVIEGVGGG